MSVKLGNKVRDTVTGFTGIAVARVIFLNGCEQIAIAPPVGKDGKATSAEYYDHQRVVVIGPGITPKESQTGGPQRDAPRAHP